MDVVACMCARSKIEHFSFQPHDYVCEYVEQADMGASVGWNLTYENCIDTFIGAQHREGPNRVPFHSKGHKFKESEYWSPTPFIVKIHTPLN